MANKHIHKETEEHSYYFNPTPKITATVFFLYKYDNFQKLLDCMKLSLAFD